jgi:dolichol-phosphate mannosyltransferase
MHVNRTFVLEHSAANRAEADSATFSPLRHEVDAAAVQASRDLATPAVSVVAPCYNEQAGLTEFYYRTTAATRDACGDAYELVLIDDGSHDDTWSVIRQLAAADPHVVGVRLMRNHGHQLAVTAGLALARGERVLLIDADLQDPPELLARMMRVMEGEEADVVYGQRIARKGESRFKLTTAALFYRLLGHLAAVPIPPDTGDFRLMRRRIVEALVAMPERQRFIRGMVSWVGGKQVPLRYERQARHAGTTHYTVLKMFHLAMDAVVGFSILPLRIASWIGFGAALVALGLFAITFWRWATGGTVAGWSSLMTAVIFFGAVQLIVMGILGEYVGRLFQEAKQRPLFLIDGVLAAGRSVSLPPEFASLPLASRRDAWRSALRTASAAAADGLS